MPGKRRRDRSSLKRPCQVVQTLGGQSILAYQFQICNLWQKEHHPRSEGKPGSHYENRVFFCPLFLSVLVINLALASLARPRRCACLVPRAHARFPNHCQEHNGKASLHGAK